MKLELAFPLLLTILAGCPTEDSGDDTDLDTDSDTEPAGFDPANDIHVEWAAQSVTISLANSDATGFYFGMAETASGGAGWYEEDCLVDDCHVITSGLALTLSSVDFPDDVVPGSTTLFDDDNDGQADAFTAGTAEDRLTYLIQTIGGTDPGDAHCYIWGDDVSYYAGENCTEL